MRDEGVLDITHLSGFEEDDEVMLQKGYYLVYCMDE